MVEKEPYQLGLARNQGLLKQLQEFQRNPRSLVFVPLADSYRQQGLHHQALEILDEGLAFHPDLSSAILSKARCLYDLRRYAEALQITKEAVQKNPENLRAHKLQAEIYVRLGQRKAAIRALTHVVLLYPQDQEAVRALEELENLDSKQNISLTHLSRASVDTAPTVGKIEDFQVGSLGDLTALPAEALQEVVDVAPALPAEAEPEPTFATRTIAELYLRQGLKAKAISVLRKLLKDDPAHEWARETLQELESDGIVLPAQAPTPVSNRKASLAKKAKALEILLARVRLLRGVGA